MAFFEVKNDTLGLEVKELLPGGRVSGNISGKPALIEVVDEVQLTRDGVVFIGERAGVVFDKEGRLKLTRRSIAFLEGSQADLLRWENEMAKTDRISPGAFQDSLTSLERLARSQAGDPKANRWTIGRLLSAILSVGTTEEYSPRE